uniref:Putative secreted protein n=1 Tax=Anopheles triannulatus TaxID=58253 RepID=A0A2M4B501_9DIPT
MAVRSVPYFCSVHSSALSIISSLASCATPESDSVSRHSLALSTGAPSSAAAAESGTGSSSPMMISSGSGARGKNSSPG